MQRLGFDLILLGDPASGKDTQAKLLMKKFSLKPVESGKYWRAMAKKKTAEGAWLRRTMSLGHPAPVALMKRFLKEQLAKTPVNKDLLFVGNPRLKPEAQLLAKMLKERKRDFFVIYIGIPVKEILSRTKLRARSKTEDAGVWNRINYTKNQVSKTVSYFKSLKKLKSVNGNRDIVKVEKDIQRIIDDYQRS
ncbi:MAG: nucleoside monophosphate kinase [Candidatus Doudnabacteria bacterium]|nr:nucleoside monophosphate kinase [Candidatus Doudnabacteria bacterium]